MAGPGPSGCPDLPLAPPPGPSRHNDLPWQLLKLFNNQLQDPGANLSSLAHTHTNIPKLKAGFVGGQVGLAVRCLRGALGSWLTRRPSLGAGYLPWPLEGTLLAPQAVGGKPEAHVHVGGGLALHLGSQPRPVMPPVLVRVRALRHPEQRRREEDPGADRRHPAHVPGVSRDLRLRHQQHRCVLAPGPPGWSPQGPPCCLWLSRGPSTPGLLGSAPQPGSPCRHPAGLPGGQGGQPGGRGGWPLHRQQPGRPAGPLPPGHAVHDPHPQLQHALVSGRGAGRRVSGRVLEGGGLGQPLGARSLLSQGRQLAGGHGR